MEEDSDFTDIPVVIPFDLNWKWEYTEIEFLLDKISQLVPEMRALGHPVWVEFIEDTDFKSHLEKYNPQEVVIFNLCEELPGIPHSCGQAAEVVESMGFTHTGASARAIYLNQDKSKVKRLLKQHGVPHTGMAPVPYQSLEWLEAIPGHRETGSGTLQHRSFSRIGGHKPGRVETPVGIYH